MIIVKLMGGMCNQMFQYAVGRALAERLGVDFKMDITGYDHQARIETPRNYSLGHFNIREQFATEPEIVRLTGRLRRLRIPVRLQRPLLKFFDRGRASYMAEPGYSFQPSALAAPDNTYLDGYWQSERYFMDCESVIRSEFTLKPGVSIDDLALARQVRADRGAVSLHIRRSDYVTSASTNQFHGTCSLEYYTAAVKLISEKSADPIHVYVFSDDIVWVKENLKLDCSVTYVSDGKLKDYEELVLMSYCRHNIIANSSFSWWGAWLNRNPGKIVVAPAKWFNQEDVDTSDLIPESWIRI